MGWATKATFKSHYRWRCSRTCFCRKYYCATSSRLVHKRVHNFPARYFFNLRERLSQSFFLPTILFGFSCLGTLSRTSAFNRSKILLALLVVTLALICQTESNITVVLDSKVLNSSLYNFAVVVLLPLNLFLAALLSD